MNQNNAEKLSSMLSKTPKSANEWDHEKSKRFKTDYLNAKKALSSKNHDKINYFIMTMSGYYD